MKTKTQITSFEPNGHFAVFFIACTLSHTYERKKRKLILLFGSLSLHTLRKLFIYSFFRFYFYYYSFELLFLLSFALKIYLAAQIRTVALHSKINNEKEKALTCYCLQRKIIIIFFLCLFPFLCLFSFHFIFICIRRLSLECVLRRLWRKK